eukprot:TRINITY_DN6386_c0_g1_i1.p1 TRINITY_DN6386_c0_g1~~TRINITY_DN6386_c0_g1_i1.p1  ORF type:complete len:587 (-),score=102.79 TRINITY_DN6386_c0_g1_i1:226-1857(-)
MIEYDGGGLQLGMIFRINGSVFPKASLFALPSAVLSMVLQGVVFKSIEAPFQILNNTAAYSAFSFVVGFLLVFRTSQAYTRFWEGTTLMQLLRGQWVGAFSSILAFSAVSKKEAMEVDIFRHKLIRLFSLLHASALQYVSTMSYEEEQFPIIGIRGIDDMSVRFVDSADEDTKIYVIIQWIQQLILSNLDTGILPIPPPIVSRVFQDLSTGVVTLNNARKISDTPFPFPYAQMVTVVLLMHLLITPLAVATWTDHWFWAGLFTFVAVFTFWSINLIAAEIEQPFGGDANDIAVDDLQHTYNRCLVAMLNPRVARLPELKHEFIRDRDALLLNADTILNCMKRIGPSVPGEEGHEDFDPMHDPMHQLDGHTHMDMDGSGQPSGTGTTHSASTFQGPWTPISAVAPDRKLPPDDPGIAPKASQADRQNKVDPGYSGGNGHYSSYSSSGTGEASARLAARAVTEENAGTQVPHDGGVLARPSRGCAPTARGGGGGGAGRERPAELGVPPRQLSPTSPGYQRPAEEGLDPRSLGPLIQTHRFGDYNT